MLYDFANIGVFVLFSALFVFGTLLVGMLFHARKPTLEKETGYECGEPPLDESWARFTTRMHNIALVFLIFEAEMALLVPVIVALRRFRLISNTLARLALVEISLFIIVLALALVYAWRKGMLDWSNDFLPSSDI